MEVDGDEEEESAPLFKLGSEEGQEELKRISPQEIISLSRRQLQKLCMALRHPSTALNCNNTHQMRDYLLTMRARLIAGSWHR